MNALRQARNARGWSQNRLVYEIEQFAQRRSLVVAARASLKTYVSEWENGKRPIGHEHAMILRGVFGLTDSELFGTSEPAGQLLVDGYAELATRIDAARSIDPAMVLTFMQQTELFRAMDRQLGASALLDQMQAHLDTLQQALSHAVLLGARRPIAAALAGAATLAAWQALDAGSAGRAWEHYELAKRAAQEANESMYLAHAMGEQAYVLSDLGKTDLAIALVREAQQVAGSAATHRVKAWLHGAEAELCALAGLESESLRALDTAGLSLPRGSEARDPEMPSVFLNESHLTRWRGHSLALLGDDGAVGELYTALSTMDKSFTRAEAGLRCDLAQAHLYRGEHAEAGEHIRAARLLANRTGSVRHRRRVEQLTKDA